MWKGNCPPTEYLSESVVRKIAKQMEVATAKKTKKLKGLKTRRNWMSPLFSGD